jgi:hypothetical protein
MTATTRLSSTKLTKKQREELAVHSLKEPMDILQDQCLRKKGIEINKGNPETEIITK